MSPECISTEPPIMSIVIAAFNRKKQKLFLCPTDVTKFYKGIRLVGTLNTRGGKNWDFRPKSAFISETVGDRPVARDAT